MANPLSADMRDNILSNSAYRDGLTDDEASPLLDWGLDLADKAGERLTLTPPDDPEQIDEVKYAIPKLMTRITWVAVHREKKGESWTEKTLHKLNDLNRTVQGEDAPQLTERVISAYAQGIDGYARNELVLDLIKHLSRKEDTPDGETF